MILRGGLVAEVGAAFGRVLQGGSLSVAAFWAGAAHPRRQKHRKMPPPGASAPAFAATVEPASMQTVYGETHRQRVMERVLKMCCTDCPCFDLMAASIRKSGPEIENRCTKVSEMTGCAAVIANSGPEIKNRCTEVPEMIGYAAVIANSGPEIKNRCTEVPEMIGCAASIRKFGLEIENLCSAIVPASRTARLQRSRGV